LQVKVPALDVQQANLQGIDIGQVAIGPITVGDLVINIATDAWWSPYVPYKSSLTGGPQYSSVR
jgi:hypothetical protein